MPLLQPRRYSPRRAAIALILAGCSGAGAPGLSDGDAGDTRDGDVVDANGDDGSGDTERDATVDDTDASGADARAASSDGSSNRDAGRAPETGTDSGSLDGAAHDANDDSAADANPDGAVPDAGPVCPSGEKACGDACVATNDPALGCGGSSCASCDLASAVSGCSVADGGPPTCAITACTGSHADCDGLAPDGCESDIASDPKNCGRCGHDCAAEIQHASLACLRGGQCDYAACDPDYIDGDGYRPNGCEVLAPSGTPEAKNGQLLLWLAQEDFVPATGTWPDRSRHHADATCALNGADCPTRGYRALTFNGYGRGFTVANPAGIFDNGFTPTVFALARPGRRNDLSESGILLSIGVDIRSYWPSGPTRTESLAACSGGQCLYAPPEWGNLWQGDMLVLGTSLAADGAATLWVGGPTSIVGAQLDPLPLVDRVPRIGQLIGEISDIVVFTGPVSNDTRYTVWQYLNARYSAFFR